MISGPLPTHRPARGISLVECIVALGILAIAFPLTFAAIAGSGNVAASSGMETRGSWIAATALEELRATREGRSPLLRQASSGELPALVFTKDGSLAGAIDLATTGNGIRHHEGKPIAFIARIQISETPDVPGPADVRIILEHPASAPAAKRTKTVFQTRVH